jgi:hypothetical protein
MIQVRTTHPSYCKPNLAQIFLFTKKSPKKLKGIYTVKHIRIQMAVSIVLVDGNLYCQAYKNPFRFIFPDNSISLIGKAQRSYTNQIIPHQH